ncbi:uncharacterized protein [Zea mays]|uniref:DUF6598 domain-containing protein n=2 Tax=Zea mays TaxID=4577 RepID=A0A1D6FPF7_MAIZE|nr:uncharacterized protein LOC103635610 [Zea mays]AQK93507.1 hypothetical protein ZEAMMB73_Zm00001d010146 [Zea mays]AQK93508.1 hypothetical protein ZEAMMB73_Zm00001d010146 [Zea mays]AQK93509.1 hypothetical protein ZEAMMB73_Zm00001d010146 [Zea mays]AQK93512.1 hypothetical protein ZEAMMB73_Zm00001d010146 [Zea mays]AQK93516.1 hypothetical protein ZEAMMB73_Zm00001d010146 [Zea mays]|eukprot:XP_008656243.2 uncharacterized protein LOC103635610 [Zea mays]
MAEGETSAEEKRRRTGPPEAQELEETKRRRTGPPEAQELEERLDSLRDKIAAARLVAGSRFGEEQRRSLLREWLRLASAKLDLDLSGMSELDRSAEALPWLVPPEEADKRTTHTRQEVQELEERMTCLQLLSEDAADDRILARRELGAAADEFLLRLTTRQRALAREYSRLANLKRPPDLSGMTEADRGAEAERLREEMLQKARQLQDQGDMSGARESEGLARIIDFDVKQGGEYLNSICCVGNIYTFDHTEESPVGPMRFTNRPWQDKMCVNCASINILSVKIACSDIDFPIQVYGTVVARDCIDYKCVYLFRRDNDHCQLISSNEESLILTGPKRGLALWYDADYVQTDLWVKDRQGHCKQFSKGIVRIPGNQVFDKCEPETVSLATRLSTVDVTYDVVECAVEATVAAEVTQGEFYGAMTAHTTRSKRRIVLFDSQVGGDKCHGLIQLMRPVVSVSVMDKLKIFATTAAGVSTGVEVTPRWNGGHEFVLTLGDATICVKVTWSMVDPRL